VSRVVAVTDSNVCLPPATAAALGLRIVPISILLTDGEGRDDTIDPRRVFDALARGETVKSSPPGVVDYVQAIDQDEPAGVIVLTPAAEFTSMYDNACHAADLVHRPVRVVDTRTAATAQGIVVLEVAAAIAGGASLDDAEAAALDAARRVELVAALGTTSEIEHSGRIPSPVIETVQRRRAQPLFRFQHGEVTPLETEAVDELAALRDAWTAEGGPGSPRSMIFHAADEARAARLRAMLRGDEDIVGFSPAMAVHTGPGVIGVAWLRPRADPGSGSRLPA
jgi:DegV family protein with EDD domain